MWFTEKFSLQHIFEMKMQLLYCKSSSSFGSFWVFLKFCFSWEFAWVLSFFGLEFFSECPKKSPALPQIQNVRILCATKRLKDAKTNEIKVTKKLKLKTQFSFFFNGGKIKMEYVLGQFPRLDRKYIYPFTELYKVKEVQKKFKWVDAQLKFKIPISLPLVPEERGELWTLVECQLI